MEGWRNRLDVVYNAEPIDYSPKAIVRWMEKGYEYVAGSWLEIYDYQNTERVAVLIVRLGEKIDELKLDLFPNLKVLISAATGITHLDIDALKSRGIKLISLRGHEEFLKTIPSTAELTWALLLNIYRKLPEALADVSNGNWNRDHFKGLQLRGKTIGIVGMGRIGSIVAGYASAFGMKVKYYDPRVTNKDFIKSKSLEELVLNSDVISLHIHPDPENVALINSKLIRLMTKDTVILNSSRGEIVDEDALWDALKENRLAAYGADVICHEMADKNNSVIWRNRNHRDIYLSPHIGGASYDAMWDCELFTQDLFFRDADMC